MRSYAVFTVLLLYLNHFGSSLPDPKVVRKVVKSAEAGLEEDADRFPITYIVSSKDNLTVLTTVTTEDEWKEYVKRNSIHKVYMNVRKQSMNINNEKDDGDPKQIVRQDVLDIATVLPKVETYEKRYLTKVTDEKPGIENIRSVKSVKSTNSNQTSPEKWLERFYSKKIVSKTKKNSAITEKPQNDITETVEPSKERATHDFQINHELPESDFNTINIFHPEHDITRKKMLRRLSQNSDKVTVAASDGTDKDINIRSIKSQEDKSEKKNKFSNFIFKSAASSPADNLIREYQEEMNKVEEDVIVEDFPAKGEFVNNKTEKMNPEESNENGRNYFENSLFEDEFMPVPDFGLSNIGPKARIQSMMMKILWQDPEVSSSPDEAGKLNNPEQWISSSYW